jgi:hypothetical protein
VIGAVLSSLLALAAGLILMRAARGSRIVTPVAVALALRAIVMVVVQLVSSGAGEHGFLYVDDITYWEQAKALAVQWQAVHLVNPSGFDYVSSYQAVFPSLAGAIFVLVGNPSVLAVKVLNVLLGAGSVVLGARIAIRIFGDAAARRAAWLLALAPTLIWWSVPMLKEALVTFLALAAVLAVLSAGSPRGVGGAVALLAVLGFTRASTGLAVGVTMALAGGWIGLRAVQRDQFEARYAIYAAAGAVAVVLALTAVSGGHPFAVPHKFLHDAGVMFNYYQGGHIDRLPVDFVKSWAAPYPWVFTSATHNWDRALYPGTWVLYAAAPAMLLGAWRLRRSPEGLYVVATVLLIVVVSAATSGFVFRQRSSADALLTIPLVAGIADWRFALRAAAVAVALVAVPAGVQAHSLVTGLVILAGAVVLACVSQFVPDRELSGFRPLPSRWRLASVRDGWPRTERPLEPV